MHPIAVHGGFDPWPEVPDLRGRDALRGLSVAVGLQQAQEREDEAEVDLDVSCLGGEGERAAAPQAAHHEGEERLQEEARVRH